MLCCVGLCHISLCKVKLGYVRFCSGYIVLVIT
jgi:hypothetical protein